MTLQTSLGAQCVQIYQLDSLNSGLIYLPSGVAGAVAAFSTGRLMNWTYRRNISKLSNGRDGEINVDSPEFSIERTTLQGMDFLLSVAALGTIGYGLVLMTKTVSNKPDVPIIMLLRLTRTQNIAAMIVMQVLTGFTTASIFAVRIVLSPLLLTSILIRHTDNRHPPHRLEHGQVCYSAWRVQHSQGPRGRWCHSRYATNCRHNRTGRLLRTVRSACSGAIPLGMVPSENWCEEKDG